MQTFILFRSKNLYKQILGFFLITGFMISAYADEIGNDVPVQYRNCGITSLTRAGQLLNNHSFDALSMEINPAIYNMYDLYVSADLCKLKPVALKMSMEELHSLNGPAILHYTQKHFVTLQEIKDDMALIYDQKKGEKWMSLEELEEIWSGNLICFEETDQGRNLTVNELKSLFGYDSSYHSSYPPGHPVYPDDRTSCDDNKVRKSGCGGGAPEISVSPVDLNLKVEDMPLWYKGGKGPDINIELIYKNEASQPDIGIGLGSTQFYPLGVNVFFNYSTFYVEKPNDNIMVIMPNGLQLLYTYDAGSYIPPSEYYNTLETSGPGFVLTMKKSKTKYYYTDPNHSKITAIEDRNGNMISFFYDANYNLDYLEDANNRIVQVTTDANGRITQIQDPIGRTAIFAYDGEGYLTNITDMAGFESVLTYGQVPAWTGASIVTKKKITAVQTPLHTTSIQYEIPATIGSTIPLYRITLTNGNGDTQVYGWAPTFSDVTPTTAITSFKDFNGNITKYTIHMPSDRITQVVYPDIYSSTFYTYDQYGHRNSITMGGYVSTQVYDSTGNLLEETDFRNNLYQYAYDGNHNLTSIIDPMNRTATIGYDGNNNLTSIVTPVSTETFTYNADGNPASFTDANNNITTYDYDGNGYVSSVNFPVGDPDTYVYDAIGRLTSNTIRGVTRTFEYDDLDQITKITLPNGQSFSLTYDFKNIAVINDYREIESFFTYDCNHSCLLIHALIPEGNINLSRDAKGNLTELSINGQTTSYEYDNLDRIIRETNPDGTFRSFEHDEIGNVVSRMDENGNQTTYIYDYDLLTHINYSDNTADVEYKYNVNGELIEMIDGIGTVNLQYDDGGRLISVIGPTASDNITYTYDGIGNQLTMAKSGLSVTYTYDDLNRLSEVNSNHFSQTYTYDAVGNLIQKLNGNGSFTSYGFDNLNRLTDLNNKKSNDETISDFNLSYGSLMIENITDHVGSSFAYEYDNANQLVREHVLNNEGKTLWDNSFSYDSQGNRISISRNGVEDQYTYNANNQLTSMTKTMITVNGIIEADSGTTVYVENIKAKTTYLGNNTLTFTATDIPLDQSKDSIQRYARVNDILATVGDSSKFVCTSKNLPDGSVNILLYADIENVDPQNINTIYIKSNLVQYAYDANGNLIQRSSGGETTNYSYNADNLLIRVDLPDGDFEEYKYNGFGQLIEIYYNGNFSKRMVYDGYLSVCSIEDSSNNTTYFTRGLDIVGDIGSIIGSYSTPTDYVYHFYNHRGDIVGNIDNNEAVAYSTDYDAFGKPMGEVGQNISDFGYSSKQYNPISGLTNFGSRHYMLEINRWTSRDPIRYDGGFNIYGFNKNNPVNYIDPNGEFAVLTGLAILGVVLVVGKVIVEVSEATRSFNNAYDNKNTLEQGIYNGDQRAHEARGAAICNTASEAMDAGRSLPGAGGNYSISTSQLESATDAVKAGAGYLLDDDCD